MKIILNECGYDNSLSIQSLNENALIDIENFTKNNLRDTIERLNCCHFETYRSLIADNRFRLLPGHRSLILEMSKRYLSNENSDETIAKSSAKSTSRATTGSGTKPNEQHHSNVDSNLLIELIKMAEVNRGKLPHSRRYSEFIQYFASYIYMISGKYSYEILCNNLPIPAASTVCELFILH